MILGKGMRMGLTLIICFLIALISNGQNTNQNSNWQSIYEKVKKVEMYDNKNEYYYVELNGKHGVCNKVGKVIIPLIYDNIEYSMLNLARVTMYNSNNSALLDNTKFKSGYVNINSGKIIMPVIFYNAHHTENGIFSGELEAGKIVLISYIGKCIKGCEYLSNNVTKQNIAVATKNNKPNIAKKDIKGKTNFTAIRPLIDYDKQKENYDVLAQKLANKYCKQISPNTGKNARFKFDSDDYKNEQRSVSFYWSAGRCMICPSEYFIITGKLNIVSESFVLESQNDAVLTSKNFYEYMKEVSKDVASSSGNGTSNEYNSYNNNKHTIINSDNAKISIKESDYLGITDEDNSCNPTEGSNYTSRVYNSRGKLLYEYTNKNCIICTGRGNTEDNYMRTSNDDYPITVEVTYTVCSSITSSFTDGKYVNAKVKVTKPCMITILPKN